MKADLYAELGVTKDASHSDIKRAYRRKATRVHPDKGGTAEQFHRLQLAYDTLNDPSARKRYDKTGTIHTEKSASALEAEVASLLAAVAGQSNAESDIVAAARQILAQQMTETLRSERMHAEHAARLERIAKRLRVKKGDNLAARAIHSEADRHRDAEMKDRDLNEHLEKVYEVLSNYEYKTPFNEVKTAKAKATFGGTTLFGDMEWTVNCKPL